MNIRIRPAMLYRKPSRLLFTLNIIKLPMMYDLTLWRNGSASDSRSEGCVFESRQGQMFFSTSLFF